MSTSGFDYDAWYANGGGDLPEYQKKRLNELWPDGDRLALCWNLATNIEDCGRLIAGQYVDPARLDQDWLRWAKREKFVALRPAVECL